MKQRGFANYRISLLIIVNILLSLQALSQTKNNWFTIKAFLPLWNGAAVELIVDDQVILKDVVRQDLFSYTGTTHTVKEANIKISKGRQSFYIPFFIEPGVIKFRDQGSKIVVYNTPTNDSFNKLRQDWDSLILAQNHRHFETAQELKRTMTADFLQNNPSSAISLRLLYENYYKQSAVDEIQYFNLFQLLHPELKSTASGQKIAIEARERYATAPGNKAPLLLLPDASKQLKPIYEPGGLTLINFWASWCIPCAKERPALQQLYKDYASKGLKITSISMDTNRAAWINDVQRFQLNWTQLCDFKGWNSPVAKSFGVKLIPMNILLDAEGNIIDKNLHMHEAEKLIQERL